MIEELDAGWNDVLQRAQRRPRPRLVVALAVGTAALVGGGSAAGVLLARSPAPKLPKAADRSNVAVVLDPVTGRVVVQAARWKRHDGVCYLFPGYSSGCSTRSKHGAMYNATPPTGFTFDARVASVTAVVEGGQVAHLRLHTIPRLGVTFFTAPRFIRGTARSFTLRDAAGHVIFRTTLVHH